MRSGVARRRKRAKDGEPEGVSRRGLFTLGLGRMLDVEDAEPGPEPFAAPADRADDDPHAAQLRAAWEHCDGFRLWEPAADVLVEAARVIPTELVLDAGCGDGTVALAATARLARVTGCDDAPALLERARARAAEAEVRVEWVRADAARMPFTDARFDTALCGFALSCCARPGPVLDELFRVVRTEGVLGFTLWEPGGLFGRLLALAADRDVIPAPWSADALRTATARRTTSHEAGRHALELAFDSRDEAVATLLAAVGPLAVAHAAAPLDAEVDAIVRELGAGADGPVVLPAAYVVVVVERA